MLYVFGVVCSGICQGSCPELEEQRLGPVPRHIPRLQGHDTKGETCAQIIMLADIENVEFVMCVWQILVC